MNYSDLKIAFVKQDVFYDLYVCPTEEKDPGKILFSTQVRVGPIALFEELNTDFYIVKEEPDEETQIYKQVIPYINPDHLSLLKEKTLDQLPGQNFKLPGSPYPQGMFAVSCYDVNWGEYDIVISINISLPTQLVMKYTKTLFAYMGAEYGYVEEGGSLFGYDVTIEQIGRGFESKELGVVEMPYSFLKENTLEKIMYRHLKRNSKNVGVFVEINSSTERPVVSIPSQYNPLLEKGYKINIHRQKIIDNLTSVYDSKYFIKMGGRGIRGNAIAEAISLGTLVIMDRDQTLFKNLVIDECNAKSIDDIVELISKLDNDDNLYNELLKKQKETLTKYYFEIPMKSLYNCLLLKRGEELTV